MNLIIDLGVSLLGSLVFLFIFWKRLKEDYSGEIIFGVGSPILIGILIGYLLAFRFWPQGFLWISFLGSIAGLTFGILRYKTRFYETLEAFIISILPWASFVYLKDSVFNSSFSSFLAFLATLFIVFISYYIDVNYRKFTWYKSGKVGFAGLATLGIIFLVRSAIAILGIRMISFVGKYEGIVSGALAFTCFLLLYNLGRVNKINR